MNRRLFGRLRPWYPTGGLMLGRDRPGPKVLLARSFAARLWGWHAAPTRGGDGALWLQPCVAVHGLGLRQPLDVAFMDSQGRVLRVARLAPGGWLVGPRGTRSVLEATAGSFHRWGLAVGVRVSAIGSHAGPPDRDAGST